MSSIPIKNVYYMLSYAFSALQEKGYKSMETEKFENMPDLCAEILIKGISSQLKRGLAKEYILKSETLSTVRGKIDVSDSIKENAIIRNKLVCEYDDFSVNTYMHQIIKTTVLVLIRSASVNSTRKKKLRQLMVFFGDVDVIDYHRIDWKLHYNRNNQTYQMLVGVCKLVLKGLLQSTSSGKSKLMDFCDERAMHKLYERFILEYYRTEHKELNVNASEIDWQVDGDKTYLPIMKTDVTLSSKKEKNRILIIDAKFYIHSMQKSQYGKETFHSGNLYQIFTYVKNKEYELRNENSMVSGMLLYAKTDEAVVPDNKEYMKICGSKIAVTNLDLNCKFEDIKRQLDGIVKDYFDE